MNMEAKQPLNASCGENQQFKDSYFKPMEGSPFTRVKQEGKYFMVMGDYRITPGLDSEEELNEYFEGNMYNNVLSMLYIVVSKLDELKKQEVKNEQ